MEQQAMSPWMVMAINMTIVFLVLISVGVLINIVHLIDPTRDRGPKSNSAAAPKAVAPAPAPAAKAATNNDEVIAVITAAVVAMGYSASQIASVRPTRSQKWSMGGRLSGRQ